MESASKAPRMLARVIGRYTMWGEIAAGGMATVHLGRLNGPLGFARTVAIKRLRPGLSEDPEFTAMLIDEARLAGRVQHPNVVPVIDVVNEDGEVLLVMDYVAGLPLSQLMKAAAGRGERLAVPLAANIVAGALLGLHAAHETRSDTGKPLGIVHRDVSPQNILVGVDGGVRVLDFGVAKAAGRVSVTRENQIKGKLRYMAPEQVCSREVGPWTDVWSACAVLWETLTGKMLFGADNDLGLLKQVLEMRIRSPRSLVSAVPESLDRAVMSGLVRDPNERLGSALELATRIERAVGPVSPREIAACVRRLAGEQLDEQARRVAQVESAARRLDELEQSATRAAAPPRDRSRETVPDRPPPSAARLQTPQEPSPAPRSVQPMHRTVRPTPRPPVRRRRRRSSFAAALAVLAIAAGGIAISRAPLPVSVRDFIDYADPTPLTGVTPQAAGAVEPTSAAATIQPPAPSAEAGPSSSVRVPAPTASESAGAPRTPPSKPPPRGPARRAPRPTEPRPPAADDQRPAAGAEGPEPEFR